MVSSYYLSVNLIFLSGIFSVPLQNVEVVPLASNGEATSAIVLPAAKGAPSRKENNTNETNTIIKPISLSDKGDKTITPSGSPSNSTSGTLNLGTTSKEISALASNRPDAEDAQRNAVLKLLDRPSNGKSFFSDQAGKDLEAKSTEKPQDNPTNKIAQNPKDASSKPTEKPTENIPIEIKPVNIAENIQQNPGTKPAETLKDVPPVKSTNNSTENPAAKPTETIPKEITPVKLTENSKENPPAKPKETPKDVPPVKPTENSRDNPAEKSAEIAPKDTKPIKLNDSSKETAGAKPAEIPKENTPKKPKDSPKEAPALTAETKAAEKKVEVKPGEASFTPGVKALSEKPLITSPSSNETSKEPKAAPKGKDDTDSKPKEAAQFLDTSKDETTGASKKNKNEAVPKEANKDPSNHKDSGNAKEPVKGDVSNVGKDLKPLLQKPTVSAATKEENVELPGVFLAVSDSEETPLASEAPPQASEKKNGQKKPNPDGGAAEIVKSTQVENPGQKGTEDSMRALEKAAPKALPTIESGAVLGPEPSPRSPAPSAPKASPPAPPAEKAAPESMEMKHHEGDSHKKKLVANTNNNLNVVKAGSDPPPNVDAQAGKEKGEEQIPNLVMYAAAGVAGFVVMIIVVLLFAKMKQKKEKKVSQGEEKFRGSQSAIPVEFGSGEAAKEITTPLSPPMSVSGRSQRSIPVSLPPPRGDEDLSGGRPMTRQLRNSSRSANKYGGTYQGSQYGGEYGPYEGSAYNESEFYDNSRYRVNDGFSSRSRDSYASNPRSVRSEKARFPYRGSVPR